MSKGSEYGFYHRAASESLVQACKEGISLEFRSQYLDRAIVFGNKAIEDAGSEIQNILSQGLVDTATKMQAYIMIRQGVKHDFTNESR